jgi:hypothetical protein
VQSPCFPTFNEVIGNVACTCTQLVDFNTTLLTLWRNTLADNSLGPDPGCVQAQLARQAAFSTPRGSAPRRESIFAQTSLPSGLVLPNRARHQGWKGVRFGTAAETRPWPGSICRVFGRGQSTLAFQFHIALSRRHNLSLKFTVRRFALPHPKLACC